LCRGVGGLCVCGGVVFLLVGVGGFVDIFGVLRLFGWI